MPVAVYSLLLTLRSCLVAPVGQLVEAPFELSAFKSYMSKIFMIVIVLVFVPKFGRGLNGFGSLEQWIAFDFHKDTPSIGEIIQPSPSPSLGAGSTASHCLLSLLSKYFAKRSHLHRISRLL